MGYYTNYTLTFQGDPEDYKRFGDDLISRSSDDSEILTELVEHGSVNDAKLYDIVDWITTVATEYPNLLLILEGDGESTDDWWQARWKGKDWEIQNAAIPPFENKNLQIDKTVR